MKPDSFGCVGATVKTACGDWIDLQDPDPATITLPSIAQGLAQTCRFGGQCPRFYSVAEHCHLATLLALSDDVPNRLAQAVFLHDAAEAYIGDVVKPLKNMLTEYTAIEDRMERAVATRFGVSFDDYHDRIKYYDRLMLKAEKTTFWPEEQEHWAGFHDLPDRPVAFGFLSPIDAKEQFLAMAKTLGLK